MSPEYIVFAVRPTRQLVIVMSVSTDSPDVNKLFSDPSERDDWSSTTTIGKDLSNS